MDLAPGVLAAFVSPGLFYGGAAAVAAPILIHLLARRRFKRVRWAAMDFLIDAERQNRRRIRMEEWILLALRCSAILLIALIVSRPFFQPGGLASAWGSSRPTERIFVLDDSFSMAYESQEGTSFDRAKLAVRRLLQMIRNEEPDDTVTILRMSDVASPVESGTYLDDAQTQELLARLEALTVSQRSIDPPRVVEGIAEFLERTPGILNAAVYFLSDFQRHDWTRQEAAAGTDADEARLLDPLVAWAGKDRGLRAVFINVGATDASNTAVTDLDIQVAQLVAGTSGTVRAKVANYANQAVQNLELHASIGHLAQPSKSVRELAAGQEASVDLEIEFLRAGQDWVRVELPPDALPIDNMRHIVADVADAIQVLIVDGEPSTEAFDDEVTFLTSALRPEGEVFSGNECTIVDEIGLEETDLEDFHVVILANVYRVSEPAVEALERFARRGGGIIFFLGDQVDLDLYNTVLYGDAGGLLPASLAEVVRAADESHLVISDPLHPAMRGIGREGDPLSIARIPFFNYFRCLPVDAALDDEVGGGAAATTAIRARSPARVIAHFDDAGEHPAIVERPFGLGRVILVTTSVDKEWNRWPYHPTFLPVMTELTHYVARRSESGREQWVGSTIELSIDPAVYQPDAAVRGPAYPAEGEVAVTAVPASEGNGLAFTWEHTNAAGVYQFVLNRREGGEVIKLVAVNLDPRESDLSACEAEELKRAAGDAPFEYLRGTDDLTGEAGEGRTELWRVFLIMAVLVLMGEQCLAWYWGRRR